MSRMVWQVSEDFPGREFVRIQSGTVHAITLRSSDQSVKTVCGRFGWDEGSPDEAERVCVQCDQALGRLLVEAQGGPR